MTEGAPYISTGESETVERAVRTGVQAFSPALIVEGLRVWHVWEPEPEQLVWVLAVLPFLMALGQNLWEQTIGRKFLGRRPPPVEV
jgi:hypothetical protein